MRDRLTAFIVTPAAAGSRHGNRVTALRWAKRLRELGVHVRVAQAWNGEPCDLLVALHAWRSRDSIARHAERRPDAPRVVALTGTDVYGELAHDERTHASLELATRLVLLQPLALRSLPAHLHAKARTIRQSAVAPADPVRLGRPGELVVVALGHLRDVKDPLLAARATTLLPADSRVHVFHLGAALDDEWRARAEAASAPPSRWTWLGERPRRQALRWLAGADLLALTSAHEGGANVVTEAIACGVPVVSTRIDGSLGILGDDYPGYVDVGDADGLARALHRAATDAGFLAELRRRCASLRPLVDPVRERESWASVLDELVP